jgi:TonB family protein
MKILQTIIILTLGWSQLKGQTDSSSTSEEWVGLIIVESMPEYFGGYEALGKYLNTTAIYTDEARNAGVSGKVYASFLVESDGSISNPKILQGVHSDLDSVSISLIRNMPKWIPATQRGESVACQFNLPIAFSLEENQGNSNRPQPSIYWSKKGKKKFYKLCMAEFSRSEEECDCWYDFVIWNYNDKTERELDFQIIFDRQKCK